MLQLHGLIMNGGVLNAVEITEEAELVKALTGYEFFGLIAVRGLLDEVGNLIQSRSKLAPHEARLNHEYMRIIPNDPYLSAAFERHLATKPDDFSPI